MIWNINLVGSRFHEILWKYVLSDIEIGQIFISFELITVFSIWTRNHIDVCIKWAIFRFHSGIVVDSILGHDFNRFGMLLKEQQSFIIQV